LKNYTITCHFTIFLAGKKITGSIQNPAGKPSSTPVVGRKKGKRPNLEEQALVVAVTLPALSLLHHCIAVAIRALRVKKN
jgi:hypothetical protein